MSPMFAEKSKYLEYFLSWYHVIQAKPSASRITTVKIPPKKARAAEELEELVVDVTGQLAAGELGMVLSEVVLVLLSMVLVLVSVVLLSLVLVLVVSGRVGMLVLVVLVLFLLMSMVFVMFLLVSIELSVLVE